MKKNKEKLKRLKRFYFIAGHKNEFPHRYLQSSKIVPFRIVLLASERSVHKINDNMKRIQTFHIQYNRKRKQNINQFQCFFLFLVFVDFIRTILTKAAFTNAFDCRNNNNDNNTKKYSQLFFYMYLVFPFPNRALEWVKCVWEYSHIAFQKKM